MFVTIAKSKAALQPVMEANRKYSERNPATWGESRSVSGRVCPIPRLCADTTPKGLSEADVEKCTGGPGGEQRG
jgi:hypothetical protein